MVLSFSNLKAQTEVFKSDLHFSENNLSNFYSSISIDSTQVYINSNDYYLHAFDKKTGHLNWSYYLANKSNTNPIVYKNTVIVGNHISEYDDKCIQLNSQSGDTIQTLKISEIFNQPVFKNDIMYTTAI
jgi:outer membrane protein assembly factor BamB